MVRSTILFSRAEIAIAIELVQERLAKGEDCGYLFLFLEHLGRVLGYACFGPAQGTLSSWNLYWIAVHRTLQNHGLGRQILTQVEAVIGARGGRRIYVETSSRRQYCPTRAFYERRGYRRVAELDDFYAEGDSKIIYAKFT
jgi:GNAT superfamily N-acetyltransferase